MKRVYRSAQYQAVGAIHLICDRADRREFRTGLLADTHAMQAAVTKRQTDFLQKYILDLGWLNRGHPLFDHPNALVGIAVFVPGRTDEREYL